MTNPTDSTEPDWRKSSYSTSGNQCVEVKVLAAGDVAVRDSKNPAAGMHLFSREGWHGFLEDIKAGHLT
jgi:hypothetical protein